MNNYFINARKVCIIGDEPIFLFGLQEQFKSWGFRSIEFIKTAEFNLQMVISQKPGLLLVVDKPGKEQYWLQLAERISHSVQVPVILLSTMDAGPLPATGAMQEGINYILLSKPCHTEDLKAAVERLLEIHIAA